MKNNSALFVSLILIINILRLWAIYKKSLTYILNFHKVFKKQSWKNLIFTSKCKIVFSYEIMYLLVY